jgi:uncharacterized protein
LNYKLSRYVAVTDPVDKKGTRMLFSTRSTQILLIPALTYEYLINNRINEIPEPVVDKLIKISAAVKEDEDELSVIINENNTAIKKQDSETLYEIIHPTSFCQLDCYYCGQRHTLKKISPDCIEKIVERIRLKIESGNQKKLVIGWFGGEPLMALDEIRIFTSRFKEICLKNGCEYSCKMVTNGYSLTKSLYHELVNDLYLKSLEVTIDGTKEFHNIHRYTKNKKGTFEKIFSNMLKILSEPDFSDLGSRVSIRCNVDKNNYQSVIPLIELLHENNIQDKIAFYTAEVRSWGNDAHKLALDSKKYAEYEMKWLEKLIEKNFKVRLLPKRKYYTCIAVSKISDVYDASGNIANCSEVSYVPKYHNTEYYAGKITTMYNNFNLEKPFLNWNDNIQRSNILCKECFIFPVCGGACPKSWEEKINPCPAIKFNINERLKLLYTSIENRSKECQ